MNFFRKFISIRRRVKQRATRFSLFVVLLMFGLFFEAYMHNFNLVYIALFFIFALAFSAGPVGMKNIGYLEVKSLKCGRLFANQEGKCFFTIENSNRQSSWALEFHTAYSVKKISNIKSKSKIQDSFTITPKSRGILELSPCKIESLFPLSTVRFVLPIDIDCKTIVYPNPIGERLSSYLNRQKSHFGEEMDFDGIARYSGSESASRIHWASVAKGEMAVKSFERLNESEALNFIFEDCASDDESRLSQLTLWVLDCEKHKLPFTIKMPNGYYDSKKESIDEILEALALY